MKPIIDIPATTTDIKGANKLAAILKKVVDAMDLAAWPEECGQIKIFILNNGENDFKTSTTSMITVSDVDDTEASAVVRREPKTSSEIHINTDFFTTGIGARFIKFGASRFFDCGANKRLHEAAFHFLAHEVHHLNEIERMAACGILFKHSKTHFAGAARPDFPDSWKTALLKLIEKYPDPEDIPQSLTTASHIVNEASADLIGIYWMSVNSMFRSSWQVFSTRLAAFRRADREKDLHSNRPNPGYDIAAAIETIVANGIPTINSIHEQTWEMCRTMILQSKDMDPEVQKLFTHKHLPALKLSEKIDKPSLAGKGISLGMNGAF